MNSCVEALNATFGLEGKIIFKEHKGLVKLSAKSKFSKLECYLQGAHITSFTVKNSENLLWLSPMALFEKGKAIRGGIPICWPWFGKHSRDASLPQHGFARNSIFDVKATKELENGDLQITLAFAANAATMEVWPYRFSLEVCITVGASLTVELMTHNFDKQVFSITEAIHSYFKVRDITNVKLNGLQGCRYYDQLADKYFVQIGLSCEFERETDKIYQMPSNELLLIDNVEQEITIKQENANAVVVWNPWIEKSKLMRDFPGDGYKNMLCVEAANARYAAVELAPGESHSIKQMISLNIKNRLKE